MKKYILILLMALPIQMFANHVAVAVGVNVGPVVAVGYSNVHCEPAVIPYYGEPLAIGYFYDEDGYLCYRHPGSVLIIRYTEFSRHNIHHRPIHGGPGPRHYQQPPRHGDEHGHCDRGAPRR